MKSKFLFVLLVLCSLFFVGCNFHKEDEEPPIDDESGLTGDFLKVKNYLYENTPSVIFNDVELITEYEKLDAYIEWETSDFQVMDSDGYINPKPGRVHEVTLTCYITINGETKDASFNVLVTNLTEEDFSKKFEKQFARTISRDYDISKTVYNYVGVTWTSSNTEVFDNDGIYHPALEDQEIEIKYSFYYNNYASEEKSFKILVEKASDYQKMIEVTQWIKEEVLKDLYLTENVTLPTMYEKYNMPIVWKSSNPNVIKSDGTINHFVYERYVNLYATIEVENGSASNAKFECIVSPLDTTNMTKQEILDNFLLSIAQEEYAQVRFGYSECPNLSTTYGHLYFYQNKPSVITDTMIPLGTSNRGEDKMTPKLVVIHDTANYRADAGANARYCQSGYSGGTTSWHYTVGNDGIFQTLPENECGGHANGSFSQKFVMIDTGIKAKSIKPQSYIDSEGYVVIDKVKSNIQVPDPTRGYADYGLIVEIGDNGNYYINESWFCGANGRNAVKGGNGNGIGIETAVNKGTDYLLTMRMLAKHVADILIRHDLSINRVVQHNTTSGKNCPQAIREAEFWYTLKDYISLEKYAQTNFKNYQFVWKSKTPIMDNTGAIALDLKNYKTVSYSVVVSENGQKLAEHDYTTKLTSAK